ncbi:MAG: hypothetical protein AAF378_11680 [Cyanobacteria bacterium P01_A01_bin.84]
MSYSEPMRVEGMDSQVIERAVINPVVDYHDRVRWGPIFAGITIAIASQLVLSALGAAIGLTVGAGGTEANTVGLGVGIWSIISLLISLFLGGWICASSCGPMNKKTALLHGVILWATTLAISSWLLASGVSGTFGAIASNAGEVLNQVQKPGGVSLPNQNNIPNVSTQEARAIAMNSAKVAWSFLFGSLVGMIAAMIGASVGARNPRVRAS